MDDASCDGAESSQATPSPHKARSGSMHGLSSWTMLKNQRLSVWYEAGCYSADLWAPCKNLELWTLINVFKSLTGIVEDGLVSRQKPQCAIDC